MINNPKIDTFLYIQIEDFFNKFKNSFYVENNAIQI